MGESATPDFSGYATRAGIKCSDGRTITPSAFEHQDGARVPLVWQHGHDSPENVLGYADLEHRSDGMYARAYFNSTPQAQNAKTLVHHGDIVSLSIYANQLVEKAKSVLHGTIRELSLVLSGANPGALIDNVAIEHSDGETETLEDEAVIYTGLELEHSDTATASHAAGTATVDATTADAADQGPTVQEVYDTLDEDQKTLVDFLVGQAVEETRAEDAAAQATHSDEGNSEAILHENSGKEEGTGMTSSAVKHNVFEDAGAKGEKQGHTLSHDAMKGIFERGIQLGSLKEAFEDYAMKEGLEHGINDIEILFPNAVNVTDTPEFLSRRIEWVAGVLDGVLHSPFSRIKSLVADITFEEARARGYIKGELKKEEWFGVSKRVTTPSTVYKKQKLDRDDILDITDFDVVVWLKAEMRLMFDEEIARAILIGDGRDVDDLDKIRDPAGAPEGAGIRSILNDHDLYAPTVTVDDGATNIEIVDQISTGLSLYKGSGGPTFYTTLPMLQRLLLTRDSFGHRLWRNSSELATELGVAAIVTVEVMEDEPDLIGIIVNLRDYRLGADKGGELTFFDFFDIDYNQYKYLYESRLSGALTKIRSAINIKRGPAGGSVATPTPPVYNPTTHVVTIPSVTGVEYQDASDNSTLTGTVTLASGESLTVHAVPTGTYFFADNVHDEWTFENAS